MGSKPIPLGPSWQQLLAELTWWKPDDNDASSGWLWNAQRGEWGRSSVPLRLWTEDQRLAYLFHAWLAQPGEELLAMAPVKVGAAGAGLVTTRRLVLIPDYELAAFDADGGRKRIGRSVMRHQFSAVRPLVTRGPLGDVRSAQFEHIESLTLGKRGSVQWTWLNRSLELRTSSLAFADVFGMAWSHAEPWTSGSRSVPRLVDYDPPLCAPGVGLVCDWCGVTIATSPQQTACPGCLRSIDWGNEQVQRDAFKADRWLTGNSDANLADMARRFDPPRDQA